MMGTSQCTPLPPSDDTALSVFDLINKVSRMGGGGVVMRGLGLLLTQSAHTLDPKPQTLNPKP